MASIYDNIKTAKDLITEVMRSGLSTKQDDICRVQDIFGHSTIEELVELANDIGRNDEHGNPDPKGTYSSGRRATQDTFYMVLFNIWNWERATRFWNQHTNPDRETLTQLKKESSLMKKELDTLENQVKNINTLRVQEQTKRLTAEEGVEKLTAELHEKEMEIIKLKAKLYDLMYAK